MSSVNISSQFAADEGPFDVIINMKSLLNQQTKLLCTFLIPHYNHFRQKYDKLRKCIMRSSSYRKQNVFALFSNDVECWGWVCAASFKERKICDAGWEKSLLIVECWSLANLNGAIVTGCFFFNKTSNNFRYLNFSFLLNIDNSDKNKFIQF